jgi:hypothetical protein
LFKGADRGFFAILAHLSALRKGKIHDEIENISNTPSRKKGLPQNIG